MKDLNVTVILKVPGEQLRDDLTNEELATLLIEEIEGDFEDIELTVDLLEVN